MVHAGAMYGVPVDLPLEPFVGHDLNQIAIGRFQLQLHFAGAGSISIQGHWELRHPDGSLLDQAEDHAVRAAYRIHQVLDVPVDRYEIDPPRSFTLVFATGHRFVVFDDSAQYESFSLQIDGAPSVFV
ncbi:MAG: hypothetical protein H6709_02025 [Kofleriaceae bacterium]|nr:hypothetical protein [Kofleriaceae bacterium]